MKLTEQQQYFTRMLTRLLNFAFDKDWGITLGEAWRSEETQKLYFEKKISKVKYGHHQKRLAIDLHIFINDVYNDDPENYKILANYWKNLDPDNIWGGDWSGEFFGVSGDYHHFQYTK